jgi:tRNA(fMet)-specific endonuclease VapC
LILDTNALSAFADGVPPVVAAVEKARHLSIPIVVLGEYRYGIALSRHRRRYEGWLDELLQVADVLPLEEECTRHYATIREELRSAGTPIPSNDVWIAALCRQHWLPILSRDRHFDCVKGLSRIGW